MWRCCERGRGLKDVPSESGTVYLEKSKPCSCCRLSRVGNELASRRKVKMKVRTKSTTEPRDCDILWMDV